ncbi:Anti-sigma-K factor RskA [Rhizobiales bacterium GAS191]|nr:Anti-sigma-K factor RskA [Rhizobiales bacterium GAS113]SEC10476.1 Anti-sigma-K factor RskA [Rhizobiales bacterium GAS191]SED09729.1 Anti-sigma-K factor RskA [Rhizobiales bacterium GAS188]
MSDQDDIDALAGEYVLGTLDAAERAAVAARRQREPDLDQAIIAWERRLGPLDEASPAIEPPEGLFARIEARIRSSTQDLTQTGAPAAPEIIDLTRRLRRWRNAAFAAGALAAGLALAVVWQDMLRPPQPSNFVAVLQKDAASPAFLVEVNLNSRLLTVRPVAAERQAGKSYELWLIHDKLGAPRSLGVIADQGFTVRPALAGYDPAVVESATYAVTLEPAGGSPTGAPTSAPIFAGKLVQATP